MKRPPHYRRTLIALLFCVFLLVVVAAAAQDGTAIASEATCAPFLNTLWITASNGCIGEPVGYICNGGSTPLVEPGGAIGNALSGVGSLVEARAVDLLRTPSIATASSIGGVAWLRTVDEIHMTGLLVGDVLVRDATPPDFPAWQSMVVETNPQPPDCAAAPRSVFLAQSRGEQPARVVINGVSLDLSGTVLVHTLDNSSFFVLLSGRLRVLALGQIQVLYPGQQVSVTHNPGDYSQPASLPAAPQPLDSAVIRNLPVALLDRPIVLPQPGYVETQGTVNLRAAPSTGASLLAEVPSGEVLTVLGRNPAGDWYHVQRNSGETGWMFAELLEQSVGAIQAVYESTPLPPQRLGLLGQIGHVNAPLGVMLRSAPDVAFDVVGSLPFGAQVNLLARSPYSPWVKVNADGMTGWIALVMLDTQAVIDALPTDYDVPPPPEPTHVPGSIGNAFPDPNRDGR